jgi:methylmalonyl-CoA mutase cobalamin-binding subunit
MLRWCSFCQEFQGENPPFENLAITHGICSTCEVTALDVTERDLAHTRILQGVQGRLWNAGRNGDLKAVDNILYDATNARVRPLDILMGIVAPMLWQIGEDWKTGALTVADEHRFTAFCEAVFEAVVARASTASHVGTTADDPPFLLMNASGNQHTLAVRMLELWLRHNDIPTLLVSARQSPEELATLITRTRSPGILVSMALAEQLPSVVALIERLAELPRPVRPKIILGGYAVKAALVPPIPSVELMPDINQLFERTSRARRQG